MALKTGYLYYKEDYPESEADKWVITTQGHYNELGPTKELVDDWDDGISWSEYRSRFLEKMKNPESQRRIEELAELSKEKDIRLICYEKPENHCYRHIVAELVKEAGGDVPPREEREKGKE